MFIIHKTWSNKGKVKYLQTIQSQTEVEHTYYILFILYLFIFSIDAYNSEVKLLKDKSI